MIVIEKISKIVSQDRIRVSCSFTNNEIEDILWFETDIENEKHLSLDNCDSFFVILFLMAIEQGKDLKSHLPVSRRLLYGIENYLMDTFLIMNPLYRKIKIEAKINNYKYPKAKAIATAMSMGVDSFYTVAENEKKQYPVTHLTLFNAGAFGFRQEENTREIFYSMVKQVKSVAKDLQLPLIWVDTNLNEILNISFVRTHTFRNLSCALLFQNLFKTYFYSSGHSIKDFRLNPSDTANYDLINGIALSSNNLEFQIFGLMATRVEKTAKLTSYEPSKKYLNVCLITTEYSGIKVLQNKYENCSKCYKCVRTMMSLDAIGKLEEYNNIFDLELFKRNRQKHLADIIYHKYRTKNVFSKEILNEMEKNNYKIPLKTYYYLLLRFFQPVLFKLKFV